MFLIEGDKIISDLLNSGELSPKNIVLFCASNEWLSRNDKLIEPFQGNIIEADSEQIKKVTSLVTAPGVMVVARTPKIVWQTDILKNDYTLVFESIRDPGNLGTIIRTSDWFGINNIICSNDSVDAYNTKVVQASMGGVMRVKIHYFDLKELFVTAERMHVPVYGTTMDGNNLYDTSLNRPGIIVFGNESAGISRKISEFFTSRVRIPDYPPGKSGSESLNIASSVAIICSELRRRERQ